MKSKIISLSVIMYFLTSPAFAGNNQDWIIRMRGIYVKPDVSSKVSVLGGNVSAGSDQVPEIDVTKFFTPNVAAELIAATTKHDMGLNGSSLGNKTSLNSVKLLPPTLTLQYHFCPEGYFRPYVGAGLNYTFFYDAKTGGVVNSIKYKDNLGYAMQAGFDYMIDEKVGINIDIKKIFLNTTATINGSIKAKVQLDPWLIGAGISYYF